MGNEQHKPAVDVLIERYPALASVRSSVADAARTIVDCYRAGGKILTCGNGGSAADAEHIVGELMKGFLKKRPIEGELAARIRRAAPQHADYLVANLQVPLRAISLVNSVSLGTAFANDQAPDLVFAQQVLGLADAGDVLIAISTSGNSANVVYAVETAKAQGCKTIALTGVGGGKLKALADITIEAPDTETYRIQEYHLPIYHALCIAAEEVFFET